jgi:hypothetical protein
VYRNCNEGVQNRRRVWAKAQTPFHRAVTHSHRQFELVVGLHPARELKIIISTWNIQPTVNVHWQNYRGWQDMTITH